MIHHAALLSQHVLRRRATDLSRRIYASLPWGHRVAGVLMVLAADSLDAFGRVIYAEFIRAVVRGMPDSPDGKQAYDLIQDVHRRGADALSPGYGKPFANRVYKILLTKFGDPEIVVEAMSDLMTKAVRGKLHVANGSSLHSAETYIIVAARNAALDLLRARGRRNEVPLIRERDDDEVTLDVEDPNSFAQLDKAMTPAQLDRLLGDLAKVHPRAPEYVRALLDGDSASEIASDWRVTPSYISKFKRMVGPQIRRVVEERLRAASAHQYSYAR